MKEIWNKGKNGGTVITNNPEGLPKNSGHTGSEAFEYYGGALVAESIWRKKDVALISAAPDMLEALKDLENDDKSIPNWLWEKIQSAIDKAINYEN